MNLSINSDVRDRLPDDVISLIEKNYTDEKHNPTIIRNMAEFYLWCKRSCRIDDLCNTILNNEEIPSMDRVLITSYLLGSKCKSTRMNAEERASISAIRQQQISHRKKMANKRRREETIISRSVHTDTTKRVRLSDDVRNESCVYFGDTLVPSDILVHCLSYMSILSAHNMRGVCKAFYKAYSLNRYSIIIPILSDKIIMNVMKKVSLHLSLSGNIKYLQSLSIQQNRISTFKREGSDAGLNIATRDTATIISNMIRECNLPTPVGYNVIYMYNRCMQKNETIAYRIPISINRGTIMIDTSNCDVEHIDYIPIITGYIGNAHTVIHRGTREQLEQLIIKTESQSCPSVIGLIVNTNIVGVNIRQLFPNLKYVMQCISYRV